MMNPYNMDENKRYLLKKRRNYSLSLLEYQKKKLASNSPKKSKEKALEPFRRNDSTSYSKY
jgi:hypothetical protein